MKVFISNFFAILFTITLVQCQAQEPTGKCFDPLFERKIESLISHTVPIVTVKEAKQNLDQYVILDAREEVEWKTSHITGAEYIGYNKPNWSVLDSLPKDQKILVYCSIGYRSEKIGEKIKDRGYSNVYNLYGSIFEWVNQGNPVENEQGKPTNTVHTFNKKWSRWLNEEKARKIW